MSNCFPLALSVPKNPGEAAATSTVEETDERLPTNWTLVAIPPDTLVDPQEIGIAGHLNVRAWPSWSFAAHHLVFRAALQVLGEWRPE